MSVSAAPLVSCEFGNPSSKNVVFMIAGFPDDHLSGWGPLISEMISLKPDIRIIPICLPGYEKGAIRKYKPMGWTFDEVVDLVNKTISFYVQDPETKIDLVIHDWGAYIGYCFETKYPLRVRRLVGLDIGLYLDQRGLPLIISMLYQLWYAIAYLVSQKVNYRLGEWLFQSFRFVPRWLQPTPHDRIERTDVNVSMCYMYYHMWYLMLFNKRGFMPQRFPTHPYLFLFGTKKNTMFHGKKHLEKIESNKGRGDKYLAVEGGHWFFRYPAKNVSFCAHLILSHLDHSSDGDSKGKGTGARL